MPVGLGPRFLIEAGFLIAVAVVAGLARFDTLTIVLVMAGAWLLVAAAEWLTARVRRTRAVGAVAPVAVAQPLDAPEPTAVQPEPRPAPEPEVTPQQIPEPTREPSPEPEAPPEPEPSEPVPTQPRVRVVPQPPPPREPEPEAAPELRPQVVSLTSRVGPREWNVWDLERIARDTAGTDVARDEERSYLLVYLREFANADGILPADFDAVVRESFGDALDAAYSS